jgi:hypothetical protein
VVDHECGVGILELKRVFIYFISSSEAVIKVFLATLSLVFFMYDAVGVGFVYKILSNIFYATPMFHKYCR